MPQTLFKQKFLKNQLLFEIIFSNQIKYYNSNYHRRTYSKVILKNPSYLFVFSLLQRYSIPKLCYHQSGLIQSYNISLFMQQLTQSPKAALLLDLKIVCVIGVANCCCHVATGAIWDYVRVPQVDPSMPTSYFGGYLALIGLSEMLLFVYLLLFYCCQRDDAKHLRSLRLVACVIATTISVAVLVMVSVKTEEYIANGHSEEDKIFGIVIMVNVVDFFSTFFTIPGYIFLNQCSIILMGKFEKARIPSEVRVKCWENSYGRAKGVCSKKDLLKRRSFKRAKH